MDGDFGLLSRLTPEIFDRLTEYREELVEVERIVRETNELAKWYDNYISKRKKKYHFKPYTVCGYCKYHKKKLTIGDVRYKNCTHKTNIGNTCRHLEKYENDYWKYKEDIKALKKLKE